MCAVWWGDVGECEVVGALGVGNVVVEICYPSLRPAINCYNTALAPRVRLHLHKHTHTQEFLCCQNSL